MAALVVKMATALRPKDVYNESFFFDVNISRMCKENDSILIFIIRLAGSFVESAKVADRHSGDCSWTQYSSVAP